MRIAKRIPADNESVAGKWSEVAPKYGLTVEEAKSAYADFIENEGFDEDGNEYANFHEWLTTDRKPYRDNTPYMKGDENPY